MDDNYRQLYRLLFDNYQISAEVPTEQGGPGIPPFAAYLRNSINEFSTNPQVVHGAELREDAKYFLLVNFHTMILIPMVLGGQISANETFEAIQSDLRTVIEVASSSEPTREVSGHVVLETVNRLWPKLRTTHMRIWGDQ